MENRLGDLWSIFDFLNPGLLGSAKVFKSFVGELNARKSDQFGPLRRLVAPYILRRMKTDRSIIADLPDKVEPTRFCKLTRRQAQLYQQVVAAMEKSLEQSDGMKRRALVLQTLMRLKQICNHPSQATGDGGYAAEIFGIELVRPSLKPTARLPRECKKFKNLKPGGKPRQANQRKSFRRRKNQNALQQTPNLGPQSIPPPRPVRPSPGCAMSWVSRTSSSRESWT